jgi:outer membrane protein assembly factor BamB
MPTRATASIYPPAYSDGIVYTMVGSDGINAYNAQTGDLVWQVEGDSWAGSGSHSRIIIDNDRVYTHLEGYMHCFNKKTGELYYKLRNIVNNSIAVDDIHVYYVDMDSNGYSSSLIAIDKNNTAEKWRYRLPARLWEAPGIDGDYLYLALGGANVGLKIGYLVKLNRYTGEAVYKEFVKMPADTVIPSGPTETPVFYQNEVIIENGDGRIYAFDKDSAEIRWTYKYEHPFIGVIRYALKIEEGILYFATQGTDLIALDAGSGSEIWKSTVMRGSCNQGPVVIYDKFLFVDSADSYVYCFDKTNGEMQFRLINYIHPIAHKDTLFMGGYTDPYNVGTDFFAAFKIVL